MSFTINTISDGRNKPVFSKVRKHLTFANVAATIAVFFAISGGAYAASKYLITSTKQISPKVLKKLGGEAGKTGLAGTQGPAGPTGPQGPQGAKGENGAPGTSGANGKDGVSVASKQLTVSEAACGKQGGSEFTAAEGKKTTACDGTSGFTKTLPSGETETGAWSFVASVEGRVLSPISFAIPLSGGLGEKQVHFVTNTEVENHTATAECPGSAEEPEAKSGNLCVYAGALFVNLKFENIGNLLMGAPGTSRSGAVLEFEAEAAAPRVGAGSWAVTAE